MWYLYSGAVCAGLVLLFLLVTLAWTLGMAAVDFITEEEQEFPYLLKRMGRFACFDHNEFNPEMIGAWFAVIMFTMFAWPIVLIAAIVTLILLGSRHYTRCKKEGKPFSISFPKIKVKE